MSSTKEAPKEKISADLSIVGTRGIPACYGGFETFAEELSTRLVKSYGLKVRVYARDHLVGPRLVAENAQTLNSNKYLFRGVEVQLLPSIKHKYFETISHTLASIWHLLFHPTPVVLVCNAANSPFLWILRLRGLEVWVNVDGIERKRAKWNAFGKAWYQFGEWCSKLFASRIISDARVISNYYEKSLGVKSDCIPYGYSQQREKDAILKAKGEFQNYETLRELGVEPGKYILYVSRLEPENNAHVVIKAHKEYQAKSSLALPLIIVGDAPYADEYKTYLRKIAGDNVHFVGFRFGTDYVSLQLGAFCYIQATEVGGTHPALVEAMGFSNAVIANDTAENREVLGKSGLFYEKNDAPCLAARLLELENTDGLVSSLRRRARKRAEQAYSWDLVVSSYLKLLRPDLQSKTAESFQQAV